jgi:hypothetical protein
MYYELYIWSYMVMMMYNVAILYLSIFHMYITYILHIKSV